MAGEPSKDKTTNVNDVPPKVNEVPLNANDVPPKPNDVPSKANDVPSKANDVPSKANKVPPKVNNVPPKANKVPPKRKVLTPREFEKKVQALKKQIYELVTLCDVPACMLIRTPDGSKTYSWPESIDDVKKFAKSYFLKKTNKPMKHCGGKVNDPLLDKQLKNLTDLAADKEKKFLNALDAKIERLKKRIEVETLKKNQEEREKDRGNCEGLMEPADLSEDENGKLVRDLERVTEALKEKIKGKRKVGECMEGTAGDEKSVKEMKLALPRVKKLLHEIQGLMMDTSDDDEDDDDDDRTWLTLGR